MRMVFDFVVYLATLAVFCNFVLFHVEGAPRLGESIFSVLFVVVSGWCAKRERRAVQLRWTTAGTLLEIGVLWFLTSYVFDGRPSENVSTKTMNIGMVVELICFQSGIWHNAQRGAYVFAALF